MPRRRATAADPAAAKPPRKKPGPPPGFRRAKAAQLHDGPRPDALRRGMNLDALAGDDLRRYAREIGLTARDAEGLSEERLRMNCKARLFDLVDEL